MDKLCFLRTMEYYLIAKMNELDVHIPTETSSTIVNKSKQGA